MVTSPDRLRLCQAYERVLADVVSGRHRPGDRIMVKDLAARLQVSTTPLREILSRLVGRGIVEQRRNEGYYLPRLDARDLVDLYEFHARCVLQALAPETLARIDVEGLTDCWSVCDAIVARRGDAILAFVRLLLDDRLRIARRWEESLVGDSARELSQLKDALNRRQTQAIAREIRRFHQSRQAISQDLALRIGRPSRLDEI